MRILFVNWAPLWRGAQHGGGVNLYVQSMAVEMARRGHDVYSVSSGWDYNFAGGTPYLRRGPDYEGVVNFVVVNASNVAPGFYNYETPENESADPTGEQLFRRLIVELAPEVVHFNNLEGFSSACVALAGEAAARVVYSLHNYHPLCNQVHLLYRNREICDDYADGARCRTCIEAPRKSNELRRRRMISLGASLPDGGQVLDQARRAKHLALNLRNALRIPAMLRAVRRERVRLVGTPLRELPPEGGAGDEPTADVGRPASAEAYARRRHEFVRAINSADLVLPVSEAVRRIYLDAGVDGERMKVIHIGNRAAELTAAIRDASSLPRSGDVIRAAFLGLASRTKGLPFLIDTLAKMPASYAKRLSLTVNALGAGEWRPQLDALAPRLAALDWQDGYQHAELPELLRTIDLGIVPPMWHDCSPQVVLEMLAMKVPVVAARIGGIPDFVSHGVNGLLFEAGDQSDLIAQLGRVIDEPALIGKLRSGIRRMKTISEHCDDLETAYRDPEPSVAAS